MIPRLSSIITWSLWDFQNGNPLQDLRSASQVFVENWHTPRHTHLTFPCHNPSFGGFNWTFLNRLHLPPLPPPVTPVTYIAGLGPAKNLLGQLCPDPVLVLQTPHISHSQIKFQRPQGEVNSTDWRILVPAREVCVMRRTPFDVIVFGLNLAVLSCPSTQSLYIWTPLWLWLCVRKTTSCRPLILALQLLYQGTSHVFCGQDSVSNLPEGGRGRSPRKSIKLYARPRLLFTWPIPATPCKKTHKEPGQIN
jgi:hypothetical protein